METDIMQQIEQKEIELDNLKEQYNKNIEIEKNKILKSNTGGMTKSLYLLGFNFESSCSRTPQYLEFHRVFKKEFTTLLKPHAQEIQFSKPNHFDVTGFFKTNKELIYYFSIGDLRWSKESMLIRTAKDFKDYTGGSNGSIRLDGNFTDNLLNLLERN
ncbi:MAG: hypothetical protein Q8O03_03985 [Nanoarchaeota archaeon]|nr:hypothetical protein [Nanoarchaeota archaeon]